MIQIFKEIYEYREMLFSLVHRDLRARYKASILGFLWTFINPLLQLLIYSLIFPYLMRITEANYAMFLFVALLPWNAFVGSLQNGSTCIIANANMVKKIYFPRMILPLSVVLGNMINYLYCMVIVLVILPITGIGYSWFMIYYPLVFFIEFLVSFGLTLIVSSLNVLYRDIEHIIGILTMLWFYATPVLYNINIIPERIQPIYRLNPMVSIIISYRDILFYKTIPDLPGLAYAFLFGVLAIIVGTAVFTRISYSFAEEL